MKVLNGLNLLAHTVDTLFNLDQDTLLHANVMWTVIIDILARMVPKVSAF